MRKSIAAFGALLLAGALAGSAVQAQDAAPARARGAARPQDAGPPTKQTYVRLSNGADALLEEPVTPDPQRGKIVLVIAHPDRVNTFTYFIAHPMAQRGYRVLMMNYHGEENSYDEFLAPIGAAVAYARKLPGVQKVILTGHSTGGAELTYYQDVAENGPKACQEAVRTYPCRAKNIDHLPPFDGIMIVDSSAGAVERLIALDPSVDENKPRVHNPAVNMYLPANGYDPATKTGKYSDRFVSDYLKAQSARETMLINKAQARLAVVESDKGDYKDDEPFVIRGSSIHTYDGARIDLSDLALLSRTHAPHPLLKADGTISNQIITSTRPGLAEGDEMEHLYGSTQNTTLRHYLSFIGMKTKPDYNITADNMTGVEWRSVGNSIPGNVQGIKVPSLFLSATCAPHLVFTEIAYDLSAAKDKEFIGIEGANHGLQPCGAQYGDPSKHAFDFLDNWLMKPGRF